MKNNYKLWIVLSFLVVFISGIVGGVILEKKILYPKSKRPARSSRHSGPHFPTLNEMAEALNLSAEQQEQIRSVFQQNEERIKSMREEGSKLYRSLREQFLAEIKNVLSEDQAQQFDAMIEEFHAQVRAEAEKRRQRSPQNKQKNDEKGDTR